MMLPIFKNKIKTNPFISRATTAIIIKDVEVPTK